ncbi:GIY-YIG nuclease family protein [Candidatus Daviesbacteria bacterium]|nr:GIY-YIG nuclease family protein [Candidatus Daviesbacteria bacterium]
MIRSKALSERVVREIEPRSESKGKYAVYILRTSSNTLYIGQTNNLEKRLIEHKNKTTKSAKYIKYFESFNLVYSEEYPTRIEAMRREFQLKKWTKAKKEALIIGKLDLLKKL